MPRVRRGRTLGQLGQAPTRRSLHEFSGGKSQREAEERGHPPARVQSDSQLVPGVAAPALHCSSIHNKVLEMEGKIPLHSDNEVERKKNFSVRIALLRSLMFS